MDEEEVDFRPPAKHRWKIAGGVLVLAALVVGALAYASRTDRTSRLEDIKEGCPCGCDHSSALVAELRAKGGEPAARGVEGALLAIGERETAGYITERMVQHRLRLLELADEMGIRVPARLVRAVGCELAGEADGIRVCAELLVHGERIESVQGKEKLIGSSFVLGLAIEELAGEARSIAPPTLRGSERLPVSRLYAVSGRGEAWNGRLGAHERVRVNAIGDIPGHLRPGTIVDAQMFVGAVTLEARAEAQAAIRVR